MDQISHYYPPLPSTLLQDPYYPPSSEDQLRTLFVAGLPEDVRPREIYNLFREFPGYESSHLRTATSGKKVHLTYRFYQGNTHTGREYHGFEILTCRYYHPPQHHPYPSYPPSSEDQLRTLFLAGLPKDVRPREIYNLFWEFPSYESSHLRTATSGKKDQLWTLLVAGLPEDVRPREIYNLFREFPGYESSYLRTATFGKKEISRVSATDHPTHHHNRLYAPSSEDQLRMLFVADLPEDVRAREIYNLFREFPGYGSSQLRSATSGEKPFGFAVFRDQHSAFAAMQAVNGMVFDLENSSPLFVDFAKSNSRSKRARIDDGAGSEKRYRRPDSSSRAIPDSGFGSVHLPGIGNSAYNTIAYPSTQSHVNFDGRPATESGFATMKYSSAPHAAQNSSPCATLFVASLGPCCSEQELIQVFSSCRGYLKLKMQSSFGAPVAFVDFQDAACSIEARDRLQGTVLYSSPGEGMRLEFARSRMGMRSKKSN